MRLLAASILLAVVLILGGTRGWSAAPADDPRFEFVSTAELTSPAPRAELAGAAVELLFAPTEAREVAEGRLLRDAATGLACAIDDRLAGRIGALGDDFLVVQGRLRGGLIEGCRVVGFDGLAWEAAMLEQRLKQRVLFEAGRL